MNLLGVTLSTNPKGKESESVLVNDLCLKRISSSLDLSKKMRFSVLRAFSNRAGARFKGQPFDCFIICRGVFTTYSNINDGGSFAKVLRGLNQKTNFASCSNSVSTTALE